MVDLHMHTKFSDGTDDVIEFLEKAEENGLEVISITDHNNINAYKALKDVDIKKYYTGKLITGIELNTKILGIPIEILGYSIDCEKIEKLIKESYLPLVERNKIEADRLYSKCISAGITLENNCLENYDGTIFASRFILNEITKFEENRNFISEDAWNDIRIFYRKYMSDPNCELFVETEDLIPSFSKAMELIRLSGGMVFIPHIFEYRDNSKKILNHILENYDIDGIECFYTTFSEEQTKELLEICKENNLYISGGSDYHGTAKKNVEMGIGHGNLNISNEIIKPWSETISDFSK